MSHDRTVDEGTEGGQGPRIPGYRSFNPIGHGGYSIVYTAYQERLDRTVAVKVIGADLRDAAAERRFTRECRAVGKLTGHPNIITVFEAGSTQDRRPFIAMQYLPSGSFSDRLAREGTLGLPEVLRTGAQIAEALQAAHDAKILHRDLKPGNILLSDRGEPVLSDFGIASLGLDTEMSASPNVFTPAFAAPEILRGGTPAVASDLYGLGATLFALLTGEPPFGQQPGDNAASMMLRILTDNVLPVGRADVPPVVENELRRLLAREPSDRPRSAAAVAAELRRLDALLGQTFRHPSPAPAGTPDHIIPSRRDVPPGEPAAGPPVVPPPLSPPGPPSVPPVPPRDAPPPAAGTPAAAPRGAVPPAAPAAPLPGTARPGTGHPGTSRPGAGQPATGTPVAEPLAPGGEAVPARGAIRPPTPIRAPDPIRAPAPSAGGPGPVPAPGTGEAAHRGAGVGVGTPPSPPSPEPERRRNRGLVAAVIILGLIVAIFIAAAIFAPSRNAPDADVSPSPTPPSSPPAITPADLEAARPHGLTASENGTAATLTWENGSTSEGLAVQLSDAAGLGALQTLPDGATAYEVPGLDPTQGYCFRVGAILGIEPTTGVVAAWSPYTCIRGARPPG